MTENTLDQKNLINKEQQAKSLVKQAYHAKGTKRIDLAKQAIKSDSNCMEAYLILADAETDIATSIDLYKQAVKAGQRKLGREFFMQNAGGLWKFDTGRLFLASLLTLAGKLADQHQYEEASSYYYQLLRLDSRDNLAARYRLFRILFILNRFEEARQLLLRFEEPDSTYWLYNDLLLSYFEQGISSQVRMKANRAIAHNDRVCELLLAPVGPVEARGSQYERDEDAREDYTVAWHYFNEYHDLWVREPNIIEWLHREFYGLDFANTHIVDDIASQNPSYLIEQGNRLIESGEFIQAEKLLTGILRERENLLARNILGYCQLLMQNHVEALKVLKVGLGTEVLNPFGYALASECAYYLKDEFNARRYLQCAINEFDQGLRTSANLGPFGEHWYQYTIIIKAVAGLLGKDKLVIDLHRRWDSCFVSVEDLYQLGVAYFNCKNYKQAIRTWNQITAPEWGFLDRFVIAAGIFQKQIIPAPQLEYLPPWYLTDDVPLDYASIDQLIENASYLLLMIADLFESPEEKDDRQKNLEVLTLSSLGQWGVQFGKAIIAENILPYCWKVAAVVGLINQGIYEPGDFVRMESEGSQKDIVISEELTRKFVEKCLPEFYDYDMVGSGRSKIGE